MPVLPRPRHEISEPVEELKWGNLDDAADARPRGLPPAPRADQGGSSVIRRTIRPLRAGSPAGRPSLHRKSLQMGRREVHVWAENQSDFEELARLRVRD
jgi:hypothetical protein